MRHPSSKSVQHSVVRFVCNSFPLNSQQTVDPHVITRQFHIRTHRCVTRQIAWIRQLQLLEPMCSSLSPGRTCSTMGIACGGADDDDDPPCATDVGNLFDVETAGETGSVVCSASLTFFRFGSASKTESGILSCNHAKVPESWLFRC